MDDYSLSEPTNFEIIFISNGIRYRYGITLQFDIIVEEYLYYNKARIRENLLFERNRADIRISPNWKKENTKYFNEAMYLTDNHFVFLSVLISAKEKPLIYPIFPIGLILGK
ncbi:MAG: hypothetical protein IPK03_03375 [Bacteroidetes bacterium]|nr:hypothetical protein [Bacteroidota bacterium]